MIKMRNKKAQIALWVVIAVVLVASIMLYFLVNKMPIAPTQVEVNPKAAIEKCTQDAVNEATDIMLPQGGFLKPTNFKWYNYTNVTYLCEDNNYFDTCLNVHPMLINEMTKEIYGYIKPKIEQCFAIMEAEEEKKGAVIELGALNMSVSLGEDNVFVKMRRDTTITKRETTQTLNDYDVAVLNPIYNLGNVAIDITNSESIGCEFHSVEYMTLHPRFNIRNKVAEDSTKIYYIKDNKFGKIMQIAIRGCALPDL